MKLAAGLFAVLLTAGAGFASAQTATPVAGAPAVAPSAKGETFDQAIEIIDPTTLRVCADPSSLPSSNNKGEGFENKIAELLAQKLHKELAYTYYPMSTGFVRKTLGERRCDVIIGYPQGDELVQNTNHYYTTIYAIVTRKTARLQALIRWKMPA